MKDLDNKSRKTLRKFCFYCKGTLHYNTKFNYHRECEAEFLNFNFEQRSIIDTLQGLIPDFNTIEVQYFEEDKITLHKNHMRTGLRNVGFRPIIINEYFSYDMIKIECVFCTQGFTSWDHEYRNFLEGTINDLLYLLRLSKIDREKFKILKEKWGDIESILETMELLEKIESIKTEFYTDLLFEENRKNYANDTRDFKIEQKLQSRIVDESQNYNRMLILSIIESNNKPISYKRIFKLVQGNKIKDL